MGRKHGILGAAIWNSGGVFLRTYNKEELKAEINKAFEKYISEFDDIPEALADDATKTAVWEVYKFIHVNTAAPFGTFRTKIRKWKKLAL